MSAGMRAPTSPEAVSALVDRTLKPGSSVSLGLSEGTVNVTLDQLGDWTIMIGLPASSERFLSIGFSLERLGFFRGTENEGTVYFLWTSALEEGRVDGRRRVETTLLEALRAVQGAKASQYIC